MTKKTCIITLSYNHLEEATKLYFESLYKYTSPDLFDLIWIDNGSTDGTVEFLHEMEKQYSNLHVLYQDTNLGYSKGNNIGLKYIQDKDYDFVGLLNNDILFTPNWLEDLKEGFDLDEQLGMLSPRENKSRMGLNAKNYMQKYPKILKSFKKPLKYCVTPYFCCVLIKKEVIDKIGLMDENFTPAYWEDNDYSLRAMYAGYSLANYNKVFVFHNHSTTSKPCQVNEIYGKNKQYFFKKHPLGKWIWEHKRTNVIKDIKKYIIESFE